MDFRESLGKVRAAPMIQQLGNLGKLNPDGRARYRPPPSDHKNDVGNKIAPHNTTEAIQSAGANCRILARSIARCSDVEVSAPSIRSMENSPAIVVMVKIPS
jgi:hypothetical protein